MDVVEQVAPDRRRMGSRGSANRRPRRSRQATRPPPISTGQPSSPIVQPRPHHHQRGGGRELAAALVMMWSGLHDWRGRLPVFRCCRDGRGHRLADPQLPIQASIWRNLFYNIHLGVSSHFQRRAVVLLPAWGTRTSGSAAAPFVLLLIWLGARRVPVLLVAALMVRFVSSWHDAQEIQFYLSRDGSALAALHLRRRRSDSSGYRLADGAWMAAPGRGGVAERVAKVSRMGALAFNAWSSGALSMLRYRDHHELVAIAYVLILPAMFSIGLYGDEGLGDAMAAIPICRSPGAAVLVPKDEAKCLTETAALAFDTLVTDHPPPASLGLTLGALVRSAWRAAPAVAGRLRRRKYGSRNSCGLGKLRRSASTRCPTSTFWAARPRRAEDGSQPHDTEAGAEDASLDPE